MNKKVVGIAYIKDGKLLVCMSKRSSKQGKYTLIGGGVEQGETPEQAIIRESREETGFELKEGSFYKVFSFTEAAASDPNLLIDMDVFVYDGEFSQNLQTSDEILKFRWYDINEDASDLSSSMTNHLLPWAIDKGLLFSDKK
jgi:8-oxo-dGTP diphosphatase